MLNFSYANPTRLVFGRSAEHEVGRVMTSILGRPGKVLVLFGGGSAHRTGILEVEAGDAFCICPVCGYTDAFHTALLRSTDGTGYDIIFICPECHSRSDIGMKTREPFL